MPAQTPLYDLMLVLSTTAEEDRRGKVLTDVEAQISGGDGSVERNDDWRTRPLAYEIDHQAEGEYHLLQFTGPAALLEGLSHSLRINDTVLRFRIIKVRPGTPPPPESAPPVLAPTAAAPPAAEPVSPEPPAAEPVAAEPVAAEPPAAEPVAAEPPAAEPVASES